MCLLIQRCPCAWNPSGNPNTHCPLVTVYNNDRVLLFGCGNSWDETWIYDLSADMWKKLNTAGNPGSRYYHSITSIYGTDKVLLFGGSYDSKYPNGTWLYDISDRTWIKKHQDFEPFNREYHQASTVWGTDQIVLYGGYYAVSDTWFHDTWTHKQYLPIKNGTYTSD